jgi:hypothetical protein
VKGKFLVRRPWDCCKNTQRSLSSKRQLLQTILILVQLLLLLPVLRCMTVVIELLQQKRDGQEKERGREKRRREKIFTSGGPFLFCFFITYLKKCVSCLVRCFIGCLLCYRHRVFSVLTCGFYKTFKYFLSGKYITQLSFFVRVPALGKHFTRA